MAKKLALVAIFVFASAFNFSTATAVTARTDSKSITAPKAPVGQGLTCGPGACR